MVTLMDPNDPQEERVFLCIRRLQLPQLRDTLAAVLSEAAKEQWTYLEFLDQILRREVDAKQGKRIRMGLQIASRLRCRFSRGGQRRQVPPGVSMTMVGYFRRCHGRSSFARGGSLVLDLLVERFAIGLRRVPPSVLIVPRPFPAKAVPKARCTSITTPTIA